MDRLVFAKLVAAELGALVGDVDPEAAMTTYRRGALNCEADGDGVAGPWREVDVLAGHLGRAVVVERQQIDLGGRHGSRAHDARGKRGEQREAAPRLYVKVRPGLSFWRCLDGAPVADSVLAHTRAVAEAKLGIFWA